MKYKTFLVSLLGLISFNYSLANETVAFANNKHADYAEHLINTSQIIQLLNKNFYLLDTAKHELFRNYQLSIHNESFQISDDYFHITSVEAHNLSLENFQNLQRLAIDPFHQFSCEVKNYLLSTIRYTCNLKYLIYFKEQPLRHFDAKDNLNKLSRNQIRFIANLSNIPSSQLISLLGELHAFGPITVSEYHLQNLNQEIILQRWTLQSTRSKNLPQKLLSLVKPNQYKKNYYVFRFAEEISTQQIIEKYGFKNNSSPRRSIFINESAHSYALRMLNLD